MPSCSSCTTRLRLRDARDLAPRTRPADRFRDDDAANAGFRQGDAGRCGSAPSGSGQRRVGAVQAARVEGPCNPAAGAPQAAPARQGSRRAANLRLGRMVSCASTHLTSERAARELAPQFCDRVRALHDQPARLHVCTSSALNTSLTDNQQRHAGSQRPAAVHVWRRTAGKFREMSIAEAGQCREAEACVGQNRVAWKPRRMRSAVIPLFGRSSKPSMRAVCWTAPSNPSNPIPAIRAQPYPVTLTR